MVRSGKGSNPKNTLYVGGLDLSVVESDLFAAFIPFGDIRDVSIPLDFTSGKHRGFGFVEFEEAEDAAASIENMHNSELFGKVLRVNYAQPMRIKESAKGWSHQAVWADADKYFEQQHQNQQPQPPPQQNEQQTVPPVTSQDPPDEAASNPMAELEKSMT